MSELKSRVAYLEGLMAGMGIPEDRNESRVLSGIIEVLGEMAGAMEGVQEFQEEMLDHVQDLDLDLSNLEADIYGLEDEEEELGSTHAFACPECGQVLAVTAGERDGAEGAAVVCPACGLAYVQDEGTCEHLEVNGGAEEFQHPVG